MGTNSRRKSPEYKRPDKTGEQSQNRAQTPTTAFLFSTIVMIHYVEIKCTAIFFKHFTDITPFFISFTRYL